MPVESLKLSSFATTATDYAHDNKLHLHTQMLAPGLNGVAGTPIKPLTDFVQGIPTKDKVLLHSLKLGSVLQPDLRAGFTPTADALEITPRWSQVVECKINLLFPETKIVALQKSFFGMLAGNTSQSKLILEQFPVFEAYFLSKIIEKAKAELRNISLWKGVRNTALQAPAAIFDGWNKKIDAAIVAGTLSAANIATIAVISASNAVTEIKKIVALLPAEWRYSDQLVCLISPAQMDMYNAHYQTSRGPIVYNNAYNKQYIEGTMIEFLVEPGLSGRESPIITTRDNFCMLYDDDFESMNLTFDYNKRTQDLAYIMQFQAQPDIIDFTEMWIGDAP